MTNGAFKIFSIIGKIKIIKKSSRQNYLNVGTLIASSAVFRMNKQTKQNFPGFFLTQMFVLEPHATPLR